MATINSILEEIALLDDESREMLIDILQKRQIEERRDRIGNDAKRALKEYHEGKLQPQSAKEVIKRLSDLSQ